MKIQPGTRVRYVVDNLATNAAGHSVGTADVGEYEQPITHPEMNDWHLTTVLRMDDLGLLILVVPVHRSMFEVIDTAERRV